MSKKEDSYIIVMNKAGCAKGGRNRWAKLTSEERSDLARSIVMARWKKRKKPLK